MMPGKKTGLCSGKQKTNNVEACLTDHEGLCRRYDAPREHDARNPNPRTEFVECEIAGYFEKEISNEENPCRAAEHRRAEPEVLAHRGIGKADVDAIKIGDEKTNAEDRD
jgi:hypothetical protein